MNTSLALLVRGLCAGLATQPWKETYAIETETRVLMPYVFKNMKRIYK